MAELHVEVPGQPRRVVPLGTARVRVGRAEDCEVFVEEIKASKRHLEIAPSVPVGGGPAVYVVTDLGSSNGTFVGEARVLRRALADGDVVRVGDTRLVFRDAPAVAAKSARPAPVVVVGGGGLVVERLDGPTSAPRAPVAAEAVREVVEGAAPARAAAAERRAVSTAAWGGGAFLVVALLFLAGVELGIGRVAASRVDAADEARSYTAILESLARTDVPFENVEEDLRSFSVRFPTSDRVAGLARLVGERRKARDVATQVEERLDDLMRAGSLLSASDVLGRLQQFRADAAGDVRLTKRIDLAANDVARRFDEEAVRLANAAASEAQRDLELREPAFALRRLSSARAALPGAPALATGALADAEARARTLATTIVDEALAAAAAQKDADLRHAGLVAALRRVVGTGVEERLGDALRAARGDGSLPSPTGPTAAGAAPSPTSPSGAPAPAMLTPEMVTKSAVAERHSRERAWGSALDAYGELLAASPPERYAAQWTSRVADLRRIKSLQETLVAAVTAAGEKGVRAKLEGGAHDVVSADATGVRVRRGEKETSATWATLSPTDVLALLSPAKPDPDQRLAVAVLAADLGERRASLDALLPLVDLPSHRDLAFDVVARRLEGRSAPPPGGYRVFENDLVDGVEYDRRVEAKQVAALEKEAGEIVARLATDPTAKRIEALRALRRELDKRRAYALLAIFDEKHWPYPHDAPSVASAYALVTAEVLKRIKSVEEVWNDSLVVKFTKAGPYEKALARHAAIVREVEAKRRDTAGLRAAAAPFALYAGEASLGIRTFYVDADERTLLRYNRWIMDEVNPSQRAEIQEPEREQVRITNEYRRMMGYVFAVEPSGAAVESVDSSNVVAILDQGRETRRAPLYCVRIDDRLVRAARGHSLDMTKHGYFSHFAPQNSDFPGSSPFDRMAKAGYQGGGASENIAGASSPLQAHEMWLRSSGHHRNILSDWADLGVGQGGNKWTQNFGIGGGPGREVPGSTPTTDPTDDSGDEAPGVK